MTLRGHLSFLVEAVVDTRQEHRRLSDARIAEHDDFGAEAAVGRVRLPALAYELGDQMRRGIHLLCLCVGRKCIGHNCAGHDRMGHSYMWAIDMWSIAMWAMTTEAKTVWAITICEPCWAFSPR